MLSGLDLSETRALLQVLPLHQSKKAVKTIFIMTEVIGQSYRFRRCVDASDAEAIHSLVRELAAFEEHADAVTQTVEDYRKDAFETEHPLFFAMLAEQRNGTVWKPVGLAVWYFTYSTWTGKSFYLHDCELILFPSVYCTQFLRSQCSVLTVRVTTEPCFDSDVSVDNAVNQCT